MQFAEPFLLWGALAVGIPVAIHFWHQKRGKPLPWAATQWLIEKDQQQSRGLRLDNIFLLLIRCLLLVLLAFMLSQPLINWLNKPQTIQRIHLVEPNAFVTDNFRFELDKARRNGEQLYWANDALEPIGDKLNAAAQTNVKPAPYSPLTLQNAINRLPPDQTELHLYVRNCQTLADVPAITVPARFRLHSVPDSANVLGVYLTVRDNKKLFINRAGKLTSGVTLDPTLRFRSSPVHTGPIRALLHYQDARERQTVRAALAALSDVYGLDLTTIDKQQPDQSYDWVLTDQVPARPGPETLYIVSGTEPPRTADNLVFTPQQLTPQTSEQVESGQLPEWLGEQLLRHYTIRPTDGILSQQELMALFVPTTRHDTAQQARFQHILGLLFVGLIVLERWLALTKNA
ncbi:hypothetical protein HNV11_13355 [Spirosoma taeanense]|uniref:Aerotolerance regulator N-terminal domain-containing protein n=1 Tax=Spirosoma taeanense TaxID=2735870 RepID=A0A6M5YBM0_9BACT|nr:BatA domain-containing protein [Spirosoma taeanense]QJW90292.1 hypothetical protein HNV11_13355 [Spirosoma taeanense]